jgi:hypothetical protein
MTNTTNTMNNTCVNMSVFSGFSGFSGTYAKQSSHNATLEALHNRDNNHYSQFEMFYIFFIMLMPFSKKYAPLIKSDVVRRKINQYTNWNLLMILANYALYNVWGIDNHIISRFIAINSMQIMTLFHLFIMYDSNVLFCVMNDEPVLLKHFICRRISTSNLVRLEYLIGNIVVHILPVYFYRKYLFLSGSGSELDMLPYIIMFKFMWVLNIFGDFNITSIYVPSFDGCNVRLVNIVVIVDFITYKVLNSFINSYSFIYKYKLY